MRSMGHPDYRYTPHSSERRKRASVVAKRRLGAPDGHSTVYGCHVPDEKVDSIRPVAEVIAKKRGPLDAHKFVKDALGTTRPWSAQDRNQAVQMRSDGKSMLQIAAALGRSKNSVIGALDRMKKSPPAGYRQVPFSFVLDAVASHFRASPDTEEVLAGCVCVAPNFGSSHTASIARYTGLPGGTVQTYVNRLRANGIWSPNGPKDMTRYFGEREPDGTWGEPDMLLVLDALVCVGKVKRSIIDGEEAWYSPEHRPNPRTP